MQAVFSNSPVQTGRKFPPELGKRPTIQSIPDFLHQLVVEIQIVHHAQPHSQHFLSLEQVTQISPGVPAAHWAVTLGVNRERIRLILGIFQIDGTVPGKESGMSGFRAGMTQSKKSTPRATASMMLLGVPTPMRYRVFSLGM